MIARNLTKMKKAILCFYIKKIRNELVFLRNRLEGLCPAPRQTTCASPGRLLRGPGSGFAAPRTLREQLAENKRQCPACPSTGVGGGWQAAWPLTRASPSGSFTNKLAKAATTHGECVGLWSAVTARTPLHLSLCTERSGAEVGLGDVAAPTMASSLGRRMSALGLHSGARPRPRT